MQKLCEMIHGSEWCQSHKETSFKYGQKSASRGNVSKHLQHTECIQPSTASHAIIASGPMKHFLSFQATLLINYKVFWWNVLPWKIISMQTGYPNHMNTKRRFATYLPFQWHKPDQFLCLVSGLLCVHFSKSHQIIGHYKTSDHVHCN